MAIGPEISSLRAVVIDDTAHEKETLLKIWYAIFAEAKYPVVIRYEANLAHREEFLAERPHFVLVDNNLDNRPNAGVEFIARMKPSYPDVCFVLFTGNSFGIDSLALNKPNPDLIVTKTYLIDNGYQKFLAQEVRRLLERCPFEELSFEDPEDFARNTFSRNEVISLVEQCVRDFAAGPVAERILQVKLKRFSGGLSGSSVFRMTIHGVARYDNIPFVLKIGPPRNIERERIAFLSLARFQLPHDMRVDVIGTGKTGAHSAICYAIALGRADGVQSGTEAIRKGNVLAVQAVQERLLRSNSVTWYRIITSPPQPAAQYFFNLKEYANEKDVTRNDGFTAALTDIATQQGLSFRRGDESFSFDTINVNSVKRTLARWSAPIVVECFCHGDLNSNNIFLDEKVAALALIDYEYTGRHYVFRDFVSFESSIRLWWPETNPPQSFVELLNSERELAGMAAGGAGVVDSARVLFSELTKLREAAFALFPTVDRKLYLIGAMMHHWKLLGIPVWNSQEKTRLAAALLATLERAQI